MEHTYCYDAMISFDGGETCQPCNISNLDDFQADVEATHNRQLITYASAMFSVQLKRPKPRKIREAPPFWTKR